MFYFQGNVEVEGIDMIFAQCQKNARNPGFTLKEVQTEDCFNILEPLTGMTKESIPVAFELTDINGDGFVTKTEVVEAARSVLRAEQTDSCDILEQSCAGYSDSICTGLTNMCNSN